MNAACQAAGVPLFVAYYRRALPRFVKVKELVESGAAGQMRYLTVELTQPAPAAPISAAQLPWRLRPEISGGGLFMDLAVHTLDFLDDVFGPVTSACGQAANQGGYYAAEDLVSGSFVFQSGVHGTGTWCFSTQHAVDRVELAGTTGRIRFPSFANDPIVLENAQGRQEWNIAHPPHVQQPLIQQIVDELCGRGRCVSSGENGARATWITEQLRRSS